MGHKRFAVYFFLPGDTCTLLEIKRQDLEDESDPGKLYHWLRYDPLNAALDRLEFRSMRANPPRQEREFAQGSLHFDDHSGTFVEVQYGVTHALRVLPEEQVPESILALIEPYLDQLTS